MMGMRVIWIIQCGFERVVYGNHDCTKASYLALETFYKFCIYINEALGPITVLCVTTCMPLKLDL